MEMVAGFPISKFNLYQGFIFNILLWQVKWDNVQAKLCDGDGVYPSLLTLGRVKDRKFTLLFLNSEWPREAKPEEGSLDILG
jgi:hypothetical protein